MGCKGIYIEKSHCEWSFEYVFGLIEAAGTGNKFVIFQNFYQAVVGGRPSKRNLILSGHQVSFICSILISFCRFLYVFPFGIGGITGENILSIFYM